jgi:hypothetical protein
LGEQDPRLARPLYQALSQPFGAFLLEQRRIESLCGLGRRVGDRQLAAALALMEPYPPWSRQLLEMRVSAYALTGHPRLSHARRDLAEFLRYAPETSVLIAR